MSAPDRGRLALAAALLAAGAFYALVWPQAPLAEPDSQGYLEVAADLRDFALSRVWARPPGYPLLLWLTGSLPAPGRTLYLVQIAMHLGAVALLATALARAGARGVSRLAFVAIALLPPFVEHAAFTLTETLLQLQLAAGLSGLFLWLRGGRARWLVASALGLGSAGLVHPTYAGAAPVLAVLVAAWCLLPIADAAFRRRAVIGSGAIVAATVLAVGGFVLHNAVRFQYAGLSPMLGVVLSHKTGRVLERIPDENAAVREILIRHRDALLVKRGSDHLAYAYIFRALPELQRETGQGEIALGRTLTALNLDLIRRAPLEYVDEVGRSLLWYFAPGVSDVTSFGRAAWKALWHLLRVAVLGGFALTLVGVAGPALLWLLRLRREAAGLVVAAKAARPGAAAEAARPGAAAEAARPGAAAEAAEAADALAGRLLLLLLGCGLVALSVGLNCGLTAAVWRLRVPVDLPILASALLAAQAFGGLRRALEEGSGAGV